MAQETQMGLHINLGGGGVGGEMGGSFKREGHVYTYDRFMLRFDRKQKSVKQLSFNQKSF